MTAVPVRPAPLEIDEKPKARLKRLAEVERGNDIAPPEGRQSPSDSTRGSP